MLKHFRAQSFNLFCIYIHFLIESSGSLTLNVIYEVVTLTFLSPPRSLPWNSDCKFNCQLQYTFSHKKRCLLPNLDKDLMRNPETTNLNVEWLFRTKHFVSQAFYFPPQTPSLSSFSFAISINATVLLSSMTKNLCHKYQNRKQVLQVLFSMTTIS